MTAPAGPLRELGGSYCGVRWTGLEERALTPHSPLPFSELSTTYQARVGVTQTF